VIVVVVLIDVSGGGACTARWATGQSFQIRHAGQLNEGRRRYYSRWSFFTPSGSAGVAMLSGACLDPFLVEMP
jgi:hypothetical protein